MVHGKIINHMDLVHNNLWINLNMKVTLPMESGTGKANLIYLISVTNFLLMALFLSETFKDRQKFSIKMDI